MTQIIKEGGKTIIKTGSRIDTMNANQFEQDIQPALKEEVLTSKWTAQNSPTWPAQVCVSSRRLCALLLSSRVSSKSPTCRPKFTRFWL